MLRCGGSWKLTVLPMLVLIVILIFSAIMDIVADQSEVRLVWLKNLGGRGVGVCWSPDGDRLVVTGDFGIAVFNSRGTTLWVRTEGGDSPSISPDGRYLAVANVGYSIRVYSLSDGAKVWEGSVSGATAVRWGSDGAFLAVSITRNYLLVRYGDLALYKWVGNEGIQVWRVEVARNEIRAIDFHPRGHVIALGSLDTVSYTHLTLPTN